MDPKDEQGPHLPSLGALRPGEPRLPDTPAADNLPPGVNERLAAQITIALQRPPLPMTPGDYRDLAPVPLTPALAAPALAASQDPVPAPIGDFVLTPIAIDAAPAAVIAAVPSLAIEPVRRLPAGYEQPVHQARGPAAILPKRAAPDMLWRNVAPIAVETYFPAAPQGTWRQRALRIAKIAAMVFAGWLAAVVVLIVVYRFVDPPFSALMVQQRVTGQPITRTWVDIGEMSPNILRAVVVSEDGRFCQHAGVDFAEIQDAIDRSNGGVPRGASTISMQVIKNLFLWPSKSYLRKAIELPLTYLMELIWPKWRIMEIYLNIAEWGPGIFGIEAASQRYFSKPASTLTSREAARLAVALPNPFRRDAGAPGPGTRRLAAIIQARARAVPPSQTSCVVPERRRGG